MDLVAHRVRRDGQPIQLGPTEYRLLRHFLENPGRVFSRQQLLEPFGRIARI
jgi:two-component system phosphate regulon response regulator PhoB